VASLLANVDERFATIVTLLYGAGLRLMECLQLRVKDIDFDRKIIVVREGKGRKDRVVMLPEPARPALQAGRIRPAQTLAMMRSMGRRFGALTRDRFKINS
jgi:integrase